jgi:hypothetical protein
MATTRERSMATGRDTGADGVARKLIVPAAVSAAAGAAGLLLTKKREVRRAAVSKSDMRQAVPKLREAVSDLPLPNVRDSGVGDLAGDLRGKLDDVLGKGSSEEQTLTAPPSRIDPEFERRRRERQERRERRRRARR